MLYAAQFAKIHRSPEDYVENLDHMLMFLARYANQSAVELQRVEKPTLIAWSRATSEFLAEEARQSRTSR